jgi:Flp pilus assembly protein TadG
MHERRRRNQRGTQVLEFALVVIGLVPLLLGVVVVGLNLNRSIQVAQLGRDAGSMYVRGVDFSQTANQGILVRLGQNLGLQTTGGNGVVILSRVTYISAAACTGITPCNSNQYVVTHRLVIGNSGLRSSDFGPAGSVTVDSYGNVANYMTDPNAVANNFSSIMTLNANEFAYISETYFPSPDYDMPGFQSGTGVYARSIF